jgi:hypothetical protein
VTAAVRENARFWQAGWTVKEMAASNPEADKAWRVLATIF